MAQDPSPIIGIIGIIITGWAAVSPLFGGTIIFYVKTKNAINGFNIHLDYFKKKFTEIVNDIKELQEQHKEIAIELGPVKKNGSLVTSDQLDRRLIEITNRIMTLEARVVGEIELLVQAAKRKEKSDIDAHDFSEEMIRKTIRILKENGTI